MDRYRSMAEVGSKKARMKVVFVMHSHHSGGAERHLVELMHGMTQQGVECVFAGPLDGWLGERLTQRGFRCFPIPFNGFFDLLSLLRLVRVLRREKPDCVHGHLTRGAFYAGWAGKIAGVPCVATAHSTNAGKHFGRAQRLIAVSHAVCRFLAESGYRESVLRTVHNGVPDYARENAGWRDQVRAEWGMTDETVLTMVARFEHVKGHDIALRALASLRHRQWTLLLAGSLDTSWAEKVKAMVDELGLADRVRFLGHTDDVGKVYACADVVIAPSRREALSLTLLEAAAFSLPVVAADVGGIGEAVLNNESGLLVRSEDPAALARAIELMLDDVAMRRRFGERGRKHYEQNFSSQSMVEKTIAVYRELKGGLQHE